MMKMQKYSLGKKKIGSLSQILCLRIAEALKGLHDNNVLHMDLKVGKQYIMMWTCMSKSYDSSY